MPSTMNSTGWWTDDDGTSWPPSLAGLIKTRRHRTRLRERATVIGSPQLVAYALHFAHLTRPVISLGVLKETLDRMEEGGYDFTEALDLQAKAPRQERLPLSPLDIATAEVAPLAKVYRFPVREVESSVPFRTPQSISYGRVQQSLAHAEVKLQREIEQGRVPTNVEACRTTIRQTLGIRPRRTWDHGVDKLP
ncbi:hypothetical protein ACFQUU_25260 [Herbaspirillum sp. GCM10030257]|uniref:hypothetical protein n=1 Tax=Herbaspirillum sp. GCM10030257 TaxID=3273393 RepID=UPI003622AE1F